MVKYKGLKIGNSPFPALVVFTLKPIMFLVIEKFLNVRQLKNFKFKLTKA